MCVCVIEPKCETSSSRRIWSRDCSLLLITSPLETSFVHWNNAWLWRLQPVASSCVIPMYLVGHKLSQNLKCPLIKIGELCSSETPRCLGFLIVTYPFRLSSLLAPMQKLPLTYLHNLVSRRCLPPASWSPHWWYKFQKLGWKSLSLPMLLPINCFQWYRFIFCEMNPHECIIYPFPQKM